MIKKNNLIDRTEFETPLGKMVACANNSGICLLEYAESKILDKEYVSIRKLLKADIIDRDNKHFDHLKKQLDGYFARSLRAFDLPILMLGTHFQVKVWQQLLQIPYADTISYRQQAELMGQSSAVRAVANANGMNKIAIIIPCHRVIGSDGSLTGYAGGIWRKKYLIDLEVAK